jgi:hypothetical protein
MFINKKAGKNAALQCNCQIKEYVYSLKIVHHFGIGITVYPQLKG